MTTTAVIYIFRFPKGRVYAGQRTVSPEALRCWPGAGTGPLPDGYKGSGNPWWHIARRHRNALTWRILARVDGPQADVDASEVRAISLARAIFGRLCVNVLPGGQGMTSEVARAVNNKPEIRAHRSATANRLWADPDYAEGQRTRLAMQQSDPGWQSRRDAGLAKAREAASAPEVRAKANASNSVTHKALAQTPERRALVCPRCTDRAPEAPRPAGARTLCCPSVHSRARHVPLGISAHPPAVHCRTERASPEALTAQPTEIVHTYPRKSL